MKIFLFFLAVLFSCVCSVVAQTKQYDVVVESGVLDPFYVNAENRLKVAVKGVPEDSVLIRVSGCGTSSVKYVLDTMMVEDFETGYLIETIDRSYAINVSEPGSAKLEIGILRKDGSVKPINTRYTKCTKLDNLVTSFMGVVDSGEVSGKYLGQGDYFFNPTVLARARKQDPVGGIRVQSFTLTLTKYRNGEQSEVSLHTSSSGLSAEMKELLKTIKTSDVITIENVKVKDLNGEVLNLTPVRLTVAQDACDKENIVRVSRTTKHVKHTECLEINQDSWTKNIEVPAWANVTYRFKDNSGTQDSVAVEMTDLTSGHATELTLTGDKGNGEHHFFTSEHPNSIRFKSVENSGNLHITIYPYQ